MTASEQHVVHGTAVAVQGRAVLIQGDSGSGKSSLALELISRGAALVADDRVEVTPHPEAGLLASAPENVAGLIEARGLGLLHLPFVTARIVAVVDMNETETERLPPAHETVIAGEALPCLRKVESPAFAAMLLAYLNGGRTDP